MHRSGIALALAVALCAAGTARADAPKRKPGLWEMNTSSSAAPGQITTMQQCIDARSDDLMQRQGADMSKEKCSKNDIRASGDSVAFESVCRFEGTTATTRGRFTGRFDSAYRGDMTTTYDPPMMGMREARTTIEARWVGPCRPGQKPGDIVMPGMGSTNMNEMMRGNAEMREMMKDNPQMQEMMKRLQK